MTGIKPEDHRPKDRPNADGPPARARSRTPVQARGEERRRAILQAAGELAADVGRDQVGIHAVARRAGASIGSMYHLFPDRDALLEALDEESVRAVISIVEGCWDVPAEQWRDMPAEGVIELLFGASLRFCAAHPHVIGSLRARAPDNREFLDLVRRVISLRLGKAQGLAAADLLFTTATATVFFLSQDGSQVSPSVLQSLQLMLLAYLERVEADTAAAPLFPARGVP